MNNDLLIDQTTGELDFSYIKRMALARAQANHRSAAPPVSWVRDELRTLKERAAIIRKRWRDAHGLPDDTAYEMMNVPAWGNSGDSFGGRV